jgi:hypothetical protein
MDVVGSEIGKTLGTDDFLWGGRGSAAVVNFDVPPSPPKKPKREKRPRLLKKQKRI